MQPLTLENLKQSAFLFLQGVNATGIPELFGVTDGKAVGTYIEHLFNKYLQERYFYEMGSAASGIDFPILEVDLKVTSIRQPQSSSPFRSASQKVYGLGYHLLIFVYDKQDDGEKKIAYLNFQHAVFVHKDHTADYQTTQGLLGILAREGNEDDILAFLEERNLPLDDIGRTQLAQRIISTPPTTGYLTISNALQWRLQYTRVISLAQTGTISGLENLLRNPDEK